MDMNKTMLVKIASALSAHTLEVKHIGPYIFRRIVHMPVTKVNEFGALIATFIRKSGEWDATVQQTMLKIDSLMKSKPDDVCWYVIETNSKMIGYFYAEITTGDYDEICCYIHHVYIDPKARHFNLLKEVESILVNFARRRGALDLRCLTGRIPRAFFKKLSGDWKIDAMRLRRCI